MAEKAILFDSSKCTACRGCQVACKQWWGLAEEKTTNWGTYENPPDLSFNTWVKIKFNEIKKPDGGIDWVFTRRSCMHCTEAACVKVCPTKALYHHPAGAVVFNKALCTGCGYCTEFCPFDVPRTSGDVVTTIRTQNKCVLCVDRITNNLLPSCVKTCPPGALMFGDRQSLIDTGNKRAQELKKDYPDASLYGEKELGGLHVMYVLPYSPRIHGLPLNPQIPAMAFAWKDILKPLGYIMAGVTLLGLGVNYITAKAAMKNKTEEK
jgi:formate dehydrogenase iron-sulfur subunit